MDDLVRELRRPFTPDAIKFKLQTGPKQRSNGEMSAGTIVGYIDARLAAERLNAVVGFGWSDDYKPVQGGMECTITIGNDHRSDVGEPADIDPTPKSLYSDAFKRAAVKYGVGVSLYALPRMYVDGKDLIARNNGRGGTKWILPDRLLPNLREQYAKWLDREGIKAFGEPLDHGASPDEQGDVETTDAQESEPTEDPMVRGRAKALFMASALASKMGADVSDLRHLVETANDQSELVALYRSFCGDLKQAGGDPSLVAQRFEEAHPPVAA